MNSTITRSQSINLLKYYYGIFIEPAITLFQVVHGDVESIEVFVFEQRVVHKIPLPASKLVGFVVPLAREIKPLWMAEFIADKIQISFATEYVRNETDHFVQGHSSVNNWRQFRHVRHVCVHFFVHQPKGDCLVPH